MHFLNYEFLTSLKIVGFANLKYVNHTRPFHVKSTPPVEEICGGGSEEHFQGGQHVSTLFLKGVGKNPHSSEGGIKF